MFNQIPVGIGNSYLSSNIAKTSLFSKINWASLLSNTQKTLNVVNQAIPLYHQVKPIINNVKTLGKINKSFNNINTPINNYLDKEKNNIENYNEKLIQDNNQYPKPTFFL